MTPAVTATGMYYGLKVDMEEKNRAISDRISTLQLNDQKDYVDKASFDKLGDKVDIIGQDVTEIKTMLKAQRHR